MEYFSYIWQMIIHYKCSQICKLSLPRLFLPLQDVPHNGLSYNERGDLIGGVSTEELSQEMANLEGLMKDLSAITANQFS